MKLYEKIFIALLVIAIAVTAFAWSTFATGVQLQIIDHLRKP